MSKKTVVFGFLGTKLDTGGRGKRWQKWRPSVALCQQEGFHVDRLELLVASHSQHVADQVVADIAEVSPQTRVVQHIMDFDDPWDLAEIYPRLLDLVQAYPFDQRREQYLINITTGTHVAQICWFLLAESRFIPAKIVQLSPPIGRDRSNPDPSEVAGTHAIIDLDLARYDAIAKRFAAQKLEATSFLKSGIATENTAFNATIDLLEQVGLRSDAPILLTGPTGAGKTALARRLYELKLKANQISGQFVEVNCATLRGDQAMSTLFGHVRGAFAGAIAARGGLMKAAHKGVLLLDEIGELGLDEQAMCLRALEDKRFTPYGADRPTSSDFQLIAGSNKDLAQAVREGTFREDLYARLTLWRFHLPGLAERPEDIEPNLDFELEAFRSRTHQNLRFNAEARRAYLRFATSAEAKWRANFRDLSASVGRLGTLAPEGRITEAMVADEIERLRARWQTAPLAGDPHAHLIQLLGPERYARLDQFDAIQLAGVAAECAKHQSLSQAGRALFAMSRQAKVQANDADRLKKYLAKFDLDFAAVTLG